MKPFYFLFFLFSITQSSHIYTTDPIIDYSNSGSFSNIGIPFKLSTPLSSDEYLNLITSFSLHTQIQKTPLNYYISNYYTPSNLFMSLSINPSECLISTSKTPTYIYTKSLDSTEYLIKFLDDQNESIGLNEGTWYVLWVNILDSNFLNLQVSKNLIQIQMKTVSSSDSNYITYDKNSVTSIFQLLDPPQTSLQMSLSFDNSEQQNLLSANNIVYIDITTHVMMKGKPRIKYILSDNSFLFSGDCLSVAKIDSPTIVAFLASNYTCQVNSLENSVSFTFLNNLERTFSLRIKVSIINPPRVIKSGFIKGYLLFEKQNILVETGETSPLLNTFNLIFSMSKLNIGWNINPANSSSFPFDLKIIRADSPSPDYYPYNSFVLNFEVQSSSPNNVKLRVNIDLITDIGAIFLSGSISETLPSYNSNTKVNCRLLTNDDSSRRIQCSEVGQLLIKNTYKIGFKMAFPFDDYKNALILQNKFGVISIESFNPYLNDYDANYLFPATSPRNLLSIPTINNKNWLPKAADYQRITVSSQDIDNAIENPSVSGNLGISTSVNSQRLIFSLNAPFSDISSSSSTANTEITDSAGLYIMTSNIFSQTEFTTIEFEDSYGFTDSSITVSTHTSSVADINYGLITFQASNSDGLLKAFDVRSTDKIFAFKPFTISQSCSVYSDSGNYDFYLVGADGVAGRLNQQTYNSYVLINVPCMTSSAFSGLHFSISNFWTGDSSTAGSLTGNMFPALLYISGKLSDSEAKNVKKLAIFLQNVEPFNSLQDYNDRNYVACSTSDVSPANCSGVINSNPDYYNYLTMNIIDFSIIDPSKQFSVIIPLKTIVNQLTISCFFATLGSSKDYPSNKPYYQILLASKRYSWRYYASPNALVFPFLITGLTNPNYGFDTSCSTCYPGNIVDTDLKIGHTDTGSTLTANDATNFAAGFTYVADENFLTANIAFTSIFSTSDNPCLTFRYSYDSTLAMKYGFFCPLQIGDIESSSKISISKIKLNFNEGSYMNGFGLFSLNNGNLASAIKSQGIIANKGTIKNHQFNPIIFKKGLIQARVYWSFQTTNPISNNNYIKFDLSQNSFFSTSNTSYCDLQYSSGKSINHSCSIYYENSRNFGYIIQTNQVIPASNFYLFHYGIDSNNVDGSETSFNVFLYAKQSGDSNYIIDQTSTAATFGYSNNVTSNPSLSLTAYFENKNYASKTYFEIGFQIKLRGLYKTEAIVLSVNALTNDNLNNLDYECIILNSNKEKTSDFLSIEMNNFDQISIMPKKEIITFTDAYYFRCYHVIIPQNLPSNGGFNISGFIRSSNNIQITSRVSIFVGSFSFTTALSYFELYLEKKLFSSPGNTQNIQFLITSNSITLTKTSRIIVWFPFYYPDLLNHDGKILCQINGIDTYCLIDQNRRVVIKFLPNDIAQGSSFVLKLIGPVQGVVKYYSSFHLAIDLDDDESFYSNIGVIKDIEYTSLSQYKLHTLMINTVVISNSYIRESINYSFSFFMPNSIGIDLLATYTYFLVEFPSFFDILLSIATPKCMLYNLDEKLQIDFVDSCSVIGSQIKILLRRDLSKGYYYNLQINSVRGPSWTVCLNKRWVINLVSNEQNIIVAKSFFNTINTGLQNFIQNPNKTLLFYQDKDGFEIKSYQLTSGVYSNPIKIVSQTGVFKKNYIMTVNQKGIFSNFPEIINGQLGSLQSTFQFSCNQTTPYGIYFLTIDKTADQSHFTELPIIPINVTFIPVPFNFETTSFSIPVGSSNFMLYIQGPLQIPNEYISLTFSLTNDSIINSGLTLIQNTIQFDKFNQYGFIYLSSQYEESFIGVSVSLQVNLSGPNANSYTLETTSLILNITDKSSYDLTANITGETNPAKVLTTNFTMSCSVAGVGYYQLTRADCSFMGIPSVISKVKNYFSFSSNDQCQNQFGIVNFESNGLSKIVNVTNIRANKNYIIYGFCQDYNDNYSSISNTNFTGKDNGGLLLKIKFFFKTAVTYLNKERLACFLNSFLGISSQKIMSSDLIYCQTIVDSRILQSTNMTNNTNNTTNSTNETLKNISIIDSNTYFSFDFYFLPIDNREIDLSYKSVYDCYNNSAKFINWINGNITGGSSVLNISEPFAIAFQESPSFSRFLELKVKVTDTSVFISEIGLSSNGSIYLEIYPGILINDTTPNYLQIMNNQQFNSSNGIKSTRVQFTYNGTTGTSYNFTNLTPNTSFIIAYFGTNDNPSYQDFLTTEIRKTNATTLNKIKQGSFGELLKIGGLFWVFLGILLSF